MAEAKASADASAAADAQAAEAKAPADAEAAQAAASDVPAAEVLTGETVVILAIGISGLRNGEPWPAVGEPITLPADEAATYLRLGYVTAPE